MLSDTVESVEQRVLQGTLAGKWPSLANATHSLEVSQAQIQL